MFKAVQSWLSRWLVSEYGLTVFVFICVSAAAPLIWRMADRAGFPLALTVLVTIFFLPLLMANALSIYLALAGLLAPGWCEVPHPRPRIRKLRPHRPSRAERRARLAILIFTMDEEDPLECLRGHIARLKLGRSGQDAEGYRRLQSRCSPPRGIKPVAIFLLSDSKKDHIIEAENEAIHILRSEHPDLQIERIQRHTVRGYAKYGNLTNWVRSPHARHFPFYAPLDWDSAITGRCLAQLLAHAQDHPDVAFVQASIRVDPCLVKTKFGEMIRRSHEYWLDAGFNRCLTGQFGHNLVARTRAARMIDRRFPMERYRESTLRSHDFLESLWASVLGYGTAMITDREGSCEGTPPTVGESIKRSVRWAFGSDRWPLLLVRHALQAPLSIQIFGWLAVLNFLNQVLVVIFTFAMVVFYPLLSRLTQTTTFERVGTTGGDWLGVTHWEPACLMAFVLGALLIERSVGLAAAMRGISGAQKARKLGEFFAMLAWSQAIAPLQSFCLAVMQIRDFFTEAKLAWEPPKREAGIRPTLLVYCGEYGWASACGAALIAVAVVNCEHNLLLAWPLYFGGMLSLSPLTAWYLDHDFIPTQTPALAVSHLSAESTTSPSHEPVLSA